jgi:hypothetical protein
MRRWLGLLCGAALVAGCGGGSGGAGSGPGGGPVSAPAVVTVTAAATTPDVNIAVVAPATTPTASVPNAQFLGVGTTAQVTGDVVHLGTVNNPVFLCGPGLSGSLQAFVGGSTFASSVNDLAIAPNSIVDTTCKRSDGTTLTGIKFAVNVSATAVPGARTIYLQAPNNDITTFTGGLEVVP